MTIDLRGGQQNPWAQFLPQMFQQMMIMKMKSRFDIESLKQERISKLAEERRGEEKTLRGKGFTEAPQEFGEDYRLLGQATGQPTAQVGEKTFVPPNVPSEPGWRWNPSKQELFYTKPEKPEKPDVGQVWDPEKKQYVWGEKRPGAIAKPGEVPRVTLHTGINPATGKNENFYLDENKKPVWTGIEISGGEGTSFSKIEGGLFADWLEGKKLNPNQMKIINRKFKLSGQTPEQVRANVGARIQAKVDKLRELLGREPTDSEKRNMIINDPFGMLEDNEHSGADQFGYTVGETRNGYKYIGNDQWQKQ